jgi:hypothetical protein
MTPFTVRPSELKKQCRTNARNFAAMTEGTVIAMATLRFGAYFKTKDEAVKKLSELPIPEQHALNKIAAQQFAKAMRAL